MIYLFNAAFPTLGVMLYEIFYRKSKKSPLLYIGLFLLLSLFHYAFDNFRASDLHANMQEMRCSLDDEDREHYWNLIHQHYYAGYRCMGIANEMTWSLPNKEKTASQAAITATGTAILTRNIKATGVAAAAEIIRETLMHYKKVWDQMSTYVYAAQYHVEMAEFYQDVLASDGG